MPTIGDIKDPVERYFAAARERQSIYLKKEAGLPRPWTDDKIFDHYKFTNVFREQDKTTRWFREYVRGPLYSRPKVLLATAIFRMFTRIEIGEIIFRPSNNGSVFESFLKSGDHKILDIAIRNRYPKGPWCTGAYLITSPQGYDKLGGISRILETFFHGKFFDIVSNEEISWEQIARRSIADPGDYTIEEMWKWLGQVPFFGTFHAGEMVSDLRYTSILDNASDINLWTNTGPGVHRGLNRIHSRDVQSKAKTTQTLREMQDLLQLSRDTQYWPNNTDYPPLELRDIAMWLCEYSKYEKTHLGEGRTRSIYGGVL